MTKPKYLTTKDIPGRAGADLAALERGARRISWTAIRDYAARTNPDSWRPIRGELRGAWLLRGIAWKPEKTRSENDSHTYSPLLDYRFAGMCGRTKQAEQWLSPAAWARHTEAVRAVSARRYAKQKLAKREAATAGLTRSERGGWLIDLPE
jgi:hypothetical protein